MGRAVEPALRRRMSTLRRSHWSCMPQKQRRVIADYAYGGNHGYQPRPATVDRRSESRPADLDGAVLDAECQPNP